MTFGPHLSLDPKFDELNLIDCVTCNNKVCVRITKSWSSSICPGSAKIRWECSICFARRYETVEELPVPAPIKSDLTIPSGRLGTCPRCSLEHQALFEYSVSPIPTESRFCIRCISEMNNIQFNGKTFTDASTAKIAPVGVLTHLDPVKAPERLPFVCGLCTEGCREVVAIGEVWACETCFDMCQDLGSEDLAMLKTVRP